MFQSNEFDEITENLMLGDYNASLDVPQLKRKGIKKILTVMDYKGGPKYNVNDFIHKRFNIYDVSGENIIQYFGECINFIRGNEKVLVHCMAGASRSAAIVIAYLMWSKKWKFEQAFNYVKLKRPIICPNDGFLKQLKMFDELLIKNDYNIEKIKFKEIIYYY